MGNEERQQSTYNIQQNGQVDKTCQLKRRSFAIMVVLLWASYLSLCMTRLSTLTPHFALKNPACSSTGFRLSLIIREAETQYLVREMCLWPKNKPVVVHAIHALLASKGGQLVESLCESQHSFQTALDNTGNLHR